MDPANFIPVIFVAVIIFIIGGVVGGLMFVFFTEREIYLPLCPKCRRYWDAEYHIASCPHSDISAARNIAAVNKAVLDALEVERLKQKGK